MTIETPTQISAQVIDDTYGVGSDWEQPNQFGESGFTRAQAESDISVDDVRDLIEEAVRVDRAQIGRALQDHDPIPGLRPHPRPSVSDLIDAYESWDGEVDTFVLAWDNYFAGTDYPCPEHRAGIHTTYLVDDGSCNGCGDKNRG